MRFGWIDPKFLLRLTVPSLMQLFPYAKIFVTPKNTSKFPGWFSFTKITVTPYNDDQVHLVCYM